MLENYSSENTMLGNELSGKCKPDYELMIKNTRAKKEKAINFIEAIFSHTGGRRLRNKMAELLGELYSEVRELEFETERLIKQQEADA